jgi:hypothetical protein
MRHASRTRSVQTRVRCGPRRPEWRLCDAGDSPADQRFSFASNSASIVCQWRSEAAAS